ncbi:MAG: hypothetical protein JJ975_04140, partial [Bacteroidia bacterium]|nr:hypothetical protein [Bacteroidia bacterium]
SFNLGLKYNSYKGLGMNWGAGLSHEMSKKTGLNAGLSIGYSDEGGMDISPDLSIADPIKQENRKSKYKVGATFNSRAGMRSMNVSRTTTTTYKDEVQDKDRVVRKSRNAKLMYNFGSSSYSPGISTPFSGFGMDFNYKFGTDIFGAYGDMTLGGSFTNQYIAKKDQVIDKAGYGYLYEQHAPQSSEAASRDYILDFQRHNQLPLMKATPYLPWAQHTNDMYGVSAQGVGGTYRLFRNEISVVHDDYRKTRDNNFRLGFEVGVPGNLGKGSVNFGYNHSGSKSGLWDDGNNLLSRIGAVNNKIDEAFYTSEGNEAKHYYADAVDYEPAFFREVNELIPQNEGFLNIVDHEDNLHPKVFPNWYSGNSYPRSATVMNTLYDDENRPIGLNADKTQNIGKERTTRNKLFSYLKGEDETHCLTKSIESITMNSTYVNGKLPIATSISRKTGSRASHISEVTIVNGDGSRHVFGIPAYNNKQIEKSFRVEEASAGDKAKGLVEYDENKDDTRDNDNGIDHFFSSTETPAYAHSYLITGVLSPDYVDLTNNGITEDDLGSAVKFNYTRTHANYKWRTPYKTDRAKYSEGYHSDNTDGTGNIVYGEKEIWHVHSIEGKTHIALFKISERNDGLGVLGEDGGKDVTQKKHKLDSIQLFSKRDLMVNGSNAVPIKTVHFEYDYELCPGVSNQVNEANGKLTLKKIYFTYGNSRKGKLNAYRFTYDNTNASYNLMTYDMWGTYTPYASSPSNGEFPYTNQTKATADGYAAMWNLTKVELPSGGVIEVEYESDDYAYVQDKRAMSMLKIKDFGRWDNTRNSFVREEALYGLGLDKEQYDYVFFDLKEDLTGSDAVDVLRKEYLKDVQDLQVTVYSKITNSGSNYEYIKTYVKPAHVKTSNGWEIDCGVTDNGETGWIRMEKQHLRDKDKGEKINPVALAAFQYTRMNLNYLIQRGGNSKKSNANGRISFPLVGTFLGMLGDIANMAAGPNRMLLVRKFCREIVPNQSWIRLNVADKQKLGGGHRVKQITINDMWEDINTSDANAVSASYGQQYSYTKKEESEVGYYTEISSGVATYEPGNGRDENPFVQPHFFDQKRPGVPDSRYTFEHPIGENFMPGPSVGYSEVTVKSIDHSGQNRSHRTGYQVSQFYTARDYPVQIKKSEVAGNSSFTKPKFSFSFIYGEKFELATAGQGYTVVLNDMHGKPSANYSYDEFGKLLSGTEFKYRTDDDGNLVNTAQVIQPNGDIEEKTLGVNVDLTVDFQKKSDQFFNADGDFNLDIFVGGIIPIFIPTLFPNVSFSETNVYTAVSTKVVRKIGLLERTTAIKEGSKIHTDNLLYDGQTGQVLLTSVGNEFDDEIYNFTYPAHWAYDRGMGQAFKNWGLEIAGLEVTNGVLSHATENLEDFLYPGDLCLLNSLRHVNKRVYVVENRKTSTPDDLCLITESGDLVTSFDLLGFNGSGTVRVIRSGRRNMASISMGSVTTRTNPVQQVGSTYHLSFSNVLATSAVQFRDNWRTDLPFISGVSCDTTITDFYWAVHNSMQQIVDSSIWQHSADNYIATDSGTNFPSSVSKTGSNNRDMHWINYDSCWQVTLLDYLGKQGADLSDLNDSIFSYRDLYVRFKDSTTSILTEEKFTLQDPYTYANNPNDEVFAYKVRGYDPYIHVSTDKATTGQYDLPIFWRDLDHANKFQTCRIGDIDGSISDFFWMISDTIYSIDTGTTLTNLEDILAEKNKISGGSVNMHVVGKADDFTISFDSTNCTVDVTCDVANITDFINILSYNVVDNEFATMEAQVRRLDWQYTHDTTVLDTVTFELTSDCYPFTECNQFCYSNELSEKVNPYRVGLAGNWRPYKSWTFVEDRDYNGSSADPRTDGDIRNYTSFWQRSGDQYTPNTSDDKWVWTNEVTEYSPYGVEIENMDPLGKYSSARYGFANTLPTAVGANMRHRQLWYESFEEYMYLNDIKDQFICPQWYFVYDSTLEYMVEHTALLDDDFSHSGNISLALTTNDSFIQEIHLNPDFDSSAITSLDGQEYFTRQKDQLTPFRPTSGKYLLSAWVHQDGNTNDTSYDETYVKIEFEDDLGGITAYELKPSGLIIEGWQRIETSFTVPANPHIMRIKYITGSEKGWFDDLRIHPFNGNMKSYAYDFRTLRLMAELDENNYATFYEYDLEGNLIRVKKETVEGIQTLQENRQHQSKSN